MRHLDIYSRSMRMDGTIDLDKLKRISLEERLEHEAYISKCGVLESAMYDILSMVGKTDRKTGLIRDTNWVINRVAKAIADVSDIESEELSEYRKLVELYQQKPINHQPIEQI